MARIFANAADRISKASPEDFPAAGGGGLISFWFKPGWNSGDSVDHNFFLYEANTLNDRLGFQKFSDNNIYCGWLKVSPTDDDRIVLADTGLFTSGTWAHWMFEWNDAANVCTLYKDGSQLSQRTSALVTYNVSSNEYIGNTSPSISSSSCMGTMAEYGRYDSNLGAGEKASLALGFSPALVAPFSLVEYLPLIGRNDPENNLLGSSRTVAVAAYADHPRIFNPIGFQLAPASAGGGGSPAIRRRNQVLVF
jgi:hypothetical protein